MKVWSEYKKLQERRQCPWTNTVGCYWLTRPQVTSYQNGSKDKLIGEPLTAGIPMLSDDPAGVFNQMAKGKYCNPTWP